MYLFISGFFMSIGIIMPGVSSTLILMIMGTYEVYLRAIANVELSIIIPMAIGGIHGAVIWLRLTKKLFSKYYEKTFYAIVGFTLRKCICVTSRYT